MLMKASWLEDGHEDGGSFSTKYTNTSLFLRYTDLLEDEDPDVEVCTLYPTSFIFLVIWVRVD